MSCSVCGFYGVRLVECLDWPGRFHHPDCVGGCVECKNAMADERRGR